MSKATITASSPADECSRVSENPIITVSENGRGFVLKNPNRLQVKKTKVDGCLFTDNREKCDYCFEIGNAAYCVIYVELKGSNIEKAYQQICSTIQHLSTTHQGLKRVCRIVASRVPKGGPEVQTLRVKMLKQHKALLEVGTTKLEDDLSKKPYI